MKKIAAWLLFLIALTMQAGAQTVPSLINYQGKLVNPSGLPINTGDYQLCMRIYDAATNGNLTWGPQVFNGQTGPGYGPLVSVVQGWFNVILGPVDTNGVSIANAFAGTNRFMEIQIGTNAPFSPRQQVLSAPYALHAGSAEVANTATFAQTAQAALTAGVATNAVNGIPAGSILSYAGSSSPSGFLACDGAAVSRGVYAALFAAIGTTYGAGDGTTTFNVPDMRGRFPAGVNAADTNFANLALVGGETAHTLTYDEMPSHNHGDITDWEVNDSPNANENYGNPGNRFAVANVGLRSGSRYYSQFTTSNAGGGKPHNNLPPFVTVNYIIKY